MYYKIYTECKNLEAIIDLLKNYFDAATYNVGLGLFKGKLEDSLTITLIDPSATWEYNLKVLDFVENLKALNSQECVLVVKSSVNITFI